MLKTSNEKKAIKQTSFSAALRSFLGYLEGTDKSLLTIKDYRLDLEAFQRFLQKECPHKERALDQLEATDLKAYEQSLQSTSLRNNTRRRKMLTVSLFLTYLAHRKKVMQGFLNKIPVPHKIERIPETISTPLLIQKIIEMQSISLIEMRNRCLFWVLAESGCLVSEITLMKFEHFEQRVPGGPAQLHICGKFNRTVPIGSELYQAIQMFHLRRGVGDWVFLGFNRYGPLRGPMSARGVELLVKEFGLKLGFLKMTPRTFRHSVILMWFDQGLTESAIQNRLGLKTNYAFKKLPLRPSNPSIKPHIITE